MCFLQVEVTRDGDLVSWAQVLLNLRHLTDSYFMLHCGLGQLGHVIKNLHLLISTCYRWAGSSPWLSDLTASTFGWSATILSSRPSLVTLWPSSLAGIVLTWRFDTDMMIFFLTGVLWGVAYVSVWIILNDVIFVKQFLPNMHLES